MRIFILLGSKNSVGRLFTSLVLLGIDNWKFQLRWGSVTQSFGSTVDWGFENLTLMGIKGLKL